MTDIVPRIFRSLEKETGRGGFDTIVTAAVASFAARRHPSERQALEFGRLVAPLWDKIETKTQRALAAALSQSPRVPRTIVEKLIDAPVDITAPFLMASPCLTPDDLRTLANAANPELRRILASRRTADRATPLIPCGPDASAKAIVVTSDDPGVLTANATLNEPGSAADDPPLHPFSAQAVEPARVTQARAALLRLAEPGKHSAKVATGAPTTLAGIVEAARSGRPDQAYDGLAALLNLSLARARDMIEDPSGKILADVLKAMRTGPADALAIIMLLKPRVGLHVGAFEAMKATYRDLDVAHCRERLGLPPASQLPQATRYQPRSADLEPRLDVGAPRPAFGRRRTLPSRTELIGGER